MLKKVIDFHDIIWNKLLFLPLNCVCTIKLKKTNQKQDFTFDYFVFKTTAVVTVKLPPVKLLSRKFPPTTSFHGKC